MQRLSLFVLGLLLAGCGESDATEADAMDASMADDPGPAGDDDGADGADDTPNGGRSNGPEPSNGGAEAGEPASGAGGMRPSGAGGEPTNAGPSGGATGSGGTSSGSAGENANGGNGGERPSSPANGGAENGGEPSLPSGGTSSAGSSSQQMDAGPMGFAGGSPVSDAGVGPVAAPSKCEDSAYDPLDFDVVYEVGPGREFETPSDVPWESIGPGTLVQIFYRAEPYRDKWVLNYPGTEEAPVVVVGMPEGGLLPVISGDGATTRGEINFTGEERSVIKIGTSNTPDNERPAYITVACLDIQNAKPGYTFENDTGDASEFADNAATITIEIGDHITIENCELHDAGNGLFSSHDTSDILVRGNYIHDNGNAGSIYEHNSYTESSRITFEFNHYGSLCDGCEGNNLKDRSAGTVIRYNWIENGNRQLDLVETDYDEIANLPEYRETFVYGNVFVEGEDEGNSQILHYGGDGGGPYRAGTLYFFYNTLVSNRPGNTTLARLSTNDESMDVRNNVLWGDNLAILDETGAATLNGNLLPSNWTDTHGDLAGEVNDAGNVESDAPGFVDSASQDFRLSPGSSAVGQTAALLPAMASHPVSFSFTLADGITSRTDLTAPGALASEP